MQPGLSEELLCPQAVTFPFNPTPEHPQPSLLVALVLPRVVLGFAPGFNSRLNAG